MTKTGLFTSSSILVLKNKSFLRGKGSGPAFQEEPAAVNPALNFFLDKIFKDEYFETEKGSFSAESPKGRG
jgi:hypothetical protein